MAEITENQLKAELKSRKFSNIYLFYGKDIYSIERYTKGIIGMLLGNDDRDMNLHEFDGKDLDIGEFSDACEALPVFAEYNCCTLCNPNVSNKAEFSKDKYDIVISEIKNIPETTVLIIYFNALDICKGRKNPDAAYKRLIDNVKKYGTVCAFPIKSPAENVKLITSLAKKKECVIDYNEALTLNERCAGDLLLIESELDKLSAYADGAPVTVDMINMLCAGEDDAQINNLTDAVLFRRSEEALKKYAELINMRHEPIVLLYSLVNSFVDNYRARAALDSGKSAADVKADFNYGTRGFVVDKTFRSMGRISSDRIIYCLELLMECEREFKTRPASLQSAALEETIIKMLN